MKKPRRLNLAYYKAKQERPVFLRDTPIPHIDNSYGFWTMAALFLGMAILSFAVVAAVLLGMH